MGAKPAIGVVGAGLIGGSIALAARRGGFPVAVHDPYVNLARKVPKGVAVLPDLAAIAGWAQILLLATPLGALTDLGRQLAGIIPAGTVVSDVGSVKGKIAEGLAGWLKGRAVYVPSHPMAGSEQNGWAAARSTLFDGTTTIVCPEFATDDAAGIEAVEAFWVALGSKTIRLSLAEHDRCVGAISHLPHALATLLSELVGAEAPEALAVVGPGFRDVTRIAGGDPALWTEIFLANREALARYLEEYRLRLERLRAALLENDRKYLEGVLDAGKRNRDTLNP